MGYDKTALTQTGVYNTAPNSTENTGAAIWMAGAGPAADSSGNIFFSSANGPFNVTGLPPAAPADNFGDTLIKLTGSLAVSDFFTPADQATLEADDLDLGSAGVMLLPDAAGSGTHPHLAIASDKESNLYMVDRDSMGQYNAVTNTNVQTVTVNGSGGQRHHGLFHYGVLLERQRVCRRRGRQRQVDIRSAMRCSRPRPRRRARTATDTRASTW